MVEGELITNIASALALAFVAGYAARLLKLPPILGYLAAGIVISPFTPGPSADIDTLRAVSDIGIIFLMFGIGLSFDLRDLLKVKATAVPGSLTLMAMVTGLGLLIGWTFELRWEEGLVLGLAMGVASSAVLSRGLIDHGLADSLPGQIAMGWSVVEDMATVVILAMLPSLAAGDTENPIREGITSAGLATFFLVGMLVVGSRAIPWVLRKAAGTGSRELFILAVVTCALGIAASATLFDVSIALGAFIAGVVVSETELGHQATADVLPLREAFAVLFFVSVGMLLDPRQVFDHAGLFAAALGTVVVAKALLVVLLFLLFPFGGRVALFVGAGIAQIGEFSFLIAQTSNDLNIIGPATYNVILAAAVVSVALNPMAYRLAPRGEKWLQGSGPLWRYLDRQGPVPITGPIQPNHVVILGYGRVGELTGHALDSLGLPFVIVEADLERARRLESAGFSVVWGDAASQAVLQKASIDRASLLVVALPDENSTVLAVRHARDVAPEVPIVARARLREELELLQAAGVEDAVVPEYEGGLELMRQALVKLGFPDEEVERYRTAIRDTHYLVDRRADWQSP